MDASPLMAGKNFDGFEAIFGEVEAEWEPTSAATLRPFLFYVQPPDSSRLKIQASDFHSLTWERTLAVYELEDLVAEIFDGAMLTVEEQENKILLV